MQAIDGANWLRKPWKLMSHNENYRHYVKRDETCEENIVVVRTSDKCYRLWRWRVPFEPFKKPTMIIYTFRSWREVEYYSGKEIEYIKEIQLWQKR